MSGANSEVFFSNFFSFEFHQGDLSSDMLVREVQIGEGGILGEHPVSSKVLHKITQGSDLGISDLLCPQCGSIPQPIRHLPDLIVFCILDHDHVQGECVELLLQLLWQVLIGKIRDRVSMYCLRVVWEFEFSLYP